MIRSEWEKAVAWHEMQRDGLTPYAELRRWRRRFWWLVAVDAGVIAAVIWWGSR